MSKKVDYLKQEIEQFESMIATLENQKAKCKDQYDATQNLADKQSLLLQMGNFSKNIAELYDEIDKKEVEINQITTSKPTDNSDNKQDNPKNQQELKFDECLCQIDFKEAIRIFNKIQEQFNNDGDVALFFLEEYLNKRGDLCLRRFRDIIKSEQYRSQFSHWQFEYEIGNFELLINRIAEKNGIKKQDIDIEFLIKTIGDSLQNNSTLFIEIYCDIDDEGEIKDFIVRFIQDFWQPLRKKIEQVTKEFEGIKVITIVKCEESEISISESLSCYFHDQNECDCFVRDKLVKIPLEYWTEKDIYDWLKDINPKLNKSKRNEIAKTIYRGTKGLPNNIYYKLHDNQWQNLITLPNSC